MGQLYLARDAALDRNVAIKLLRVADDEEQRARFLHEARAAAVLSHPNVVTVFELGEQDGRPFIAMEYIEGLTLAAIVRERPPRTLSKRLEIVADVCSGLAAAHRMGLVHRDVKPSNIMVTTDGIVKVLDFGIARMNDSKVTQVGTLLGSLNYMAPEQVTGGAVDARTDVFGVAAVLYELVTLRQAFPGDLNSGILHRILTAEPKPVGEVHPAVDEKLRRIIAKGLHKEPDQRFGSLDEMRAELTRCAAMLRARDTTRGLSPDGDEAGVADTIPGEAAEEVALDRIISGAGSAVLSFSKGTVDGEPAGANAADDDGAAAPEAASVVLADLGDPAESLPNDFMTLDGTVAAPLPTGLEAAAAPAEEVIGDGTVFLQGAALGPQQAATGHAQLVVAGSGQVFALVASRMEIGRADCDIVLADPGVSRHHAVIELTETGYVISDLGSSNGTFVNGRQIREPAPLFFGASVAVGHAVMIFTSVSDTRLPDLTGCEIGDRYALTRKLRESATGAVYVARDRHIHGDVAIKLLSPHLARYPGYRDQFEREVSTAAQLFHPNICRVLDSGAVRIRAKDGETIDSIFLSYALMGGGDLTGRLADRNPVPLDRAERWIATLADALEHAHRRGVVHGDLKPAAIVFDEDENLYVAEFAMPQGELTGPKRGAIVGSPPYMSPEQWDDGVPTPASDQFALAAIAYYLVTGSRPFEGQDNPDVRRKNFRRGPIPAHKEAAHHGRPVIGRAVSDVLARALSPAPDARYPSAKEFAKAFRKALRGIGDSPHVFLSYHRSASSGWANTIADKLKDRHGMNVFLDVTRLDGAGQFPARIADAIRNCNVFVCLLAERTLDSEWVMNEIRLAHQFGKPMVPVRQESFTDRITQDDDALRALISSQGVRLLDAQNIYVEQAIAQVASLVTSVLNDDRSDD